MKRFLDWLFSPSGVWPYTAAWLCILFLLIIVLTGGK